METKPFSIVCPDCGGDKILYGPSPDDSGAKCEECCGSGEIVHDPEGCRICALLDSCPDCDREFEEGALAAGIPLSVIRGETKLNDHFSEAYIDQMCGREPKEDE